MQRIVLDEEDPDDHEDENLEFSSPRSQVGTSASSSPQASLHSLTELRSQLLYSVINEIRIYTHLEPGFNETK